MKLKSLAWIVAALCLAPPALLGCRDNDPEEPEVEESVGEEAEEAAEEAGEAAEQAGDDAEEAVDEAEDEVDEEM